MNNLKDLLNRAATQFITEVVEGAAEAALEVVEDRLEGASEKVRDARKKVRRRKRRSTVTVETAAPRRNDR